MSRILRKIGRTGSMDVELVALLNTLYCFSDRMMRVLSDGFRVLSGVLLVKFVMIASILLYMNESNTVEYFPQAFPVLI